jgi:hypothetical protein
MKRVPVRRGGKGDEPGELAADDLDRVKEREPVRILPRLERSLAQEAADGEMGQQQAVELLGDEVRRLAPQDDAGAPQVGLEFVERSWYSAARSAAGAAAGSRIVVSSR